MKAGTVLCAHSIKPFDGAARAADAGPMGIECREGVASRCAGTVERSTVDHAARPEGGFCREMLQGETLRKLEEQICSVIR